MGERNGCDAAETDYGYGEDAGVDPGVEDEGEWEGVEEVSQIDLRSMALVRTG